MRKILVTGINGYIGSRLSAINSAYHLIGITRGLNRTNHNSSLSFIRADITEADKISNIIKDSDSEAVIHLAAVTHIDPCEQDKRKGQNGQTWKVNVDGTKIIAKSCAESSKFLIYLSSECVFDGKKGMFTEDDIPNPINWYGETKYRGEQEVIKSGSKYCILRAVLSYGHQNYYPHDLLQIFYNSYLKNETVKAVTDQKLNLTFIDDLVKLIFHIVNHKIQGIFHYGGDTILSPFDLALKVKHLFAFDKGKLLPATLSDYFGSKAKFRLQNATLSTSKILQKLYFPPSKLENSLKLWQKNLK